MMLNSLPMPIEQCLHHIQRFKHGDRNRCLYALRQHLRLRDIVALRTVGDVLDDSYDIRRTVLNADGVEVSLHPRARSELHLYLMRHFGSDLVGVDRSLGLFPTEKNRMGAFMTSLPQLMWSMDVKLRRVARDLEMANSGKHEVAVSPTPALVEKKTVDGRLESTDELHRAPAESRPQPSVSQCVSHYFRNLGRSLIGAS